MPQGAVIPCSLTLFPVGHASSRAYGRVLLFLLHPAALATRMRTFGTGQGIDGNLAVFALTLSLNQLSSWSLGIHYMHTRNSISIFDCV